MSLLEIEKELAMKRQATGGKNGRDIQLGLVQDDAKPTFNAKATEVVAKKAACQLELLREAKES